MNLQRAGIRRPASLRNKRAIPAFGVGVDQTLLDSADACIHKRVGRNIAPRQDHLEVVRAERHTRAFPLLVERQRGEGSAHLRFQERLPLGRDEGAHLLAALVNDAAVQMVRARRGRRAWPGRVGENVEIGEGRESMNRRLV